MVGTSFPSQLPGPRPMFLLGWRGNLLRFARDPIGVASALRRKYGDLSAFVQGGSGSVNSTFAECPGVVFAFGPQYNQLLLSDTSRFHATLLTGLEGTQYERLVCGLLRMNGEQHRQQRRLVMPAFQKQRIESYAADVIAVTEQALRSWRPGQRRDLAADMRQLTLRIAGRILFGLENLAEADRMGRRIVHWLELIGTPGVLIARWNLPFSPYRKLLRLSRRVDSAIGQMIKEKRLCAQDNGDVLSMLIHGRDDDGGRMTEDELVGQATLLFMAGHETTANALAWTLLLLAQHPEIMTALYDELHGRLHGDPPTCRQLEDLPLLEQVVRESLRLLPPVPFGSRTARAPFQLGDYELPAYTEVIFSQYHTHRDAALYSGPERFHPARWNSISPSAYEYLPFGAGPRMCVGATLALLEARIVLAMLLQRFRVELPRRARIDRFVNITLSPKQGLPMIVRQQDCRFALNKTELRGNICEMVQLN